MDNENKERKRKRRPFFFCAVATPASPIELRKNVVFLIANSWQSWWCRLTIDLARSRNRYWEHVVDVFRSRKYSIPEVLRLWKKNAIYFKWWLPSWLPTGVGGETLRRRRFFFSRAARRVSSDVSRSSFVSFFATYPFFYLARLPSFTGFLGCFFSHWPLSVDFAFCSFRDGHLSGTRFFWRPFCLINRVCCGLLLCSVLSVTRRTFQTELDGRLANFKQILTSHRRVVKRVVKMAAKTNRQEISWWRSKWNEREAWRPRGCRPRRLLVENEVIILKEPIRKRSESERRQVSWWDSKWNETEGWRQRGCWSRRLLAENEVIIC